MNDFGQGLRAIVLAVTRAAVELVRQRPVPFRRGQYPPAVEDAAGRFGDFLDRATAASALAAAVTALTVLTVWRLAVSTVLWSAWRAFHSGRQAILFLGRSLWATSAENRDRRTRAEEYRKWLRQSNGTAASRRTMVCLAYGVHTPPPETLLWVMGAEDDRVRRKVYRATTAQQRVILRRQHHAEDERRRLALRLRLEATSADGGVREHLLKAFHALCQKRVVDRDDRRRWKGLWEAAWRDRHALVLEARAAAAAERAGRREKAVDWWSQPKVKERAGMILAGVTAVGLFLWCVAKSPAVTWAAVLFALALIPLALFGRVHTAEARRRELARLAAADQEAARREASKKR